MVKNSMNESMVTFCRRPRNRVDSGHLKFEQLNLNNCTAFMGLSSNMTVLLEA